MAKNETKSQAEIYREERKARIAKAAKKNAKNIEKSRKAGKIVSKIVAVILVIAIICGLGVWVNSLTGISQKLTKTMTITAGSNTYKVDAVEFTYYYSNYYNNLYSMSSQYSQYYGYDPTGFDTTLEGMTTDEDGNEIAWSDLLKNYAIDAIKNNYALYNAAVAAKLTLSDDDKSDIDETIEEIKTQADEYGYSVDAFLAAYYGTGMNEKTFRAIAERQALAQEYQTKLETEITDGIETSEIESTYKASTKDYDYVDVHYYIFTADTLTAEDGETEDDFNARQDKENTANYNDAKAIFDKVTDVASFETALAEYTKAQEAEDAETSEDTDAEEVDTTSETTDETSEEETEDEQYSTPVICGTYSSIESATNTDMADWVYSADRKDTKKILQDETKTYIVIVDRAPYQTFPVDYYDCLLTDSTDDDGNTVSAEDTAESLLKDWDNKEDSFATIVKDNTTDTDNTGIIEGARTSDVSDDDIKAWLFSSDRKAGDTEIITTDDGTHILYFKKSDTDSESDQYNTIRADLADEAIDTKTDELVTALSVNTNDKAVERQVSKYVKKLQQNAAQSSST